MRKWTRWRTPHKMAMVLTAATQRCDICVCHLKSGEWVLAVCCKQLCNGRSRHCLLPLRSGKLACVPFGLFVKQNGEWIAAHCRRLQHDLERAWTADKTVDGHAKQRQLLCVSLLLWTALAP